jgi:hypothetical protein
VGHLWAHVRKSEGLHEFSISFVIMMTHFGLNHHFTTMSKLGMSLRYITTQLSHRDVCGLLTCANVDDTQGMHVNVLSFMRGDLHLVYPNHKCGPYKPLMSYGGSRCEIRMAPRT